MVGNIRVLLCSYILYHVLGVRLFLDGIGKISTSSSIQEHSFLFTISPKNLAILEVDLRRRISATMCSTYHLVGAIPGLNLGSVFSLISCMEEDLR